MSTTDLPRLILEQQLSNPSLSGIIPLWQQLLDNLNLPTLKSAQTIQLATVTSPSVNRPTTGPPPCTVDKPPPEPTSKLECWLALMHGLEADASRFRHRMNGTALGNSTCKLCFTAPEDVAHFILHCPSPLHLPPWITLRCTLPR